jgi:putative FmdB family regulatory protein
MPIYEFFCKDCNTIFNFFARTINTEKRPLCPKCKKHKLERQVSMFAAVGKAKDSGGEGGEGGEGGDLPIDESKMERAVTELAGEAEGINENDPRSAARLMRKFSKMTGMEFGGGMEQALQRLEAGEDPDKIESEMGDVLDGEEPFVMDGRKGSRGLRKGPPPARRDKTLYEL